MSSKDKESKSMQEKFKTFFKLNKSGSGDSVRVQGDFRLTEKVQRELCRESSLAVRLGAIAEIKDALLNSKTDDATVLKIWALIQDLVQEQQGDARHKVFQCLHCLVQGPGKRLTVFRVHMFRIVREHKFSDDVAHRFELLQALTENGKDLVGFEEQVAPFMLEWLPEIIIAAKITEFLCLLVNVIKFNGAYISEDTITGFVNHVCSLCCSRHQISVVDGCLTILDTIIAYYRNLPASSLPQFIGVLCRIVNSEPYCATSWKIMRNLLGTHMGHSTIFTMCRILKDPSLKDDFYLLRGAIIFLHMGIWGSQSLTNIRCHPSTVLMYILEALRCNNPLITYETVLAMQTLVKLGEELHEPTWDMILQILALAIQQIYVRSPHNQHRQVVQLLHETLNSIETLIENGNFQGELEQFYDILADCTASRPETSVTNMIDFLKVEIDPKRHLWFQKINKLLNRFFKYENEKRTTVRLKTLEVLTHILEINKKTYEDELIDHIVVPHLCNLPNDFDYKVRSAGAFLLINLCLQSETKRCLEMLDILEKLLNRPFEVHSSDNNPASDADTADVKTVVDGLIKIFTKKIHRLPSLHAVRIYKMLVNHLELHYFKPKVFENCNYVRLKVLECFLKMRADHLYRLGCPDSTGNLRFSYYLFVTYRSERGPLASPPPVSPAPMQMQSLETHVSMRAGFKIFVTCLTLEKDWNVLSVVLREIPAVLENKSLILSKHGNKDIGLLVDTVCNMIPPKQIPEPFNQTVNRSDYFASILNVLPSLASYHGYLENSHQSRIIRQLHNLKFGLGLWCSRQCVTALMTCTLEMREVMKKMLPEVLLVLSKSSSTIQLAIPMLEFLSTLAVVPELYSSFITDQYMTIFAISVPYTNPFKYNQFTVSLAHHVIAVWFLKCRVPYHRELLLLVKYITKSLQTYAHYNTEESTFACLRSDVSKLNQDSSDRKRSSSLTERSTRRDRGSVMGRAAILEFQRAPMDKALIPFYADLTETCIDLMARYTFSVNSALPRRMPSAEVLLSGGQSKSWLVGNRLITITTSGSSQSTLRQGICEKCWAFCRSDEIPILKTSRSSSTHDKDDSNRITRQNSGSNNNTSASSPIDEAKKLSDKLEQLPSKLEKLVSTGSSVEKRCVCWCSNWAEIYIRRPTGDSSYIMRIQNQVIQPYAPHDFPLHELSTTFLSSFGEKSEPEISSDQPSRQSSRDSVEEDLENLDGNDKSRNPVRRSNSSPEMSANWKNHFLQQKQEREELRLQDDETGKKKNFSKDMRVSCEAIPEEIAGTTPPSHDSLQIHPSLLSSLSCPGPENSKPYQTFPPSPSIPQTQPLLCSPTPTNKANLLKTSKSESTESVSSEKSLERPTNLPNLNTLPLLTGKPPQSPTQTSPRLSRHNKDGHEIQKSSSLVLDKSQKKKLGGNTGSTETMFNQSELNLNSLKRDRSHTVSVMSPARKPCLENLRHPKRNKEVPRSGLDPSAIFLQFFHEAHYESEKDKPLLITANDMVQRAIKVLDCIPPYETHKIGVIYVGLGQCHKETEILRNKYGSVRYQDFLTNLGGLIKLADVDSQVVFLGGLDHNGGDGKYAYYWHDDIIKVIFHEATLMPIKESDPNCNNKKLHIGNNNVTIVYNESGEDYNINTIKGQFNFASVVITPLDHNNNRVVVKTKDELTEFVGNTEPKYVSNQNVAILARQLAIHANLASLVRNSLKTEIFHPYASNWLERLRKIKNLRNKILQDIKKPEQDEGNASKSPPHEMDDFTEYTL